MDACPNSLVLRFTVLVLDSAQTMLVIATRSAATIPGWTSAINVWKKSRVGLVYHFISVYHHLPWGVINPLLGKGLCHHPWVLVGVPKMMSPRPKQFLEIRDGQWLWPNNHFPTSIKKNDPAFISKNLKNKKNTLY